MNLSSLRWAALLLGSVACTPEDEGGALRLSVLGLPDGVAAAITVTGPEGFEEAPTASERWSDLTPGTYTVDASALDGWSPSPVRQDAEVTAGGSAEAEVLYVEVVRSISIDPIEPTILISGQLNFSATVSGVEDPRVDWSVIAGSAGGLVTPSAASTTTAFLAGTTPGDCEIVATSVADPELRATTTIHVVGPAAFAIEPAELSVLPGSTQTFVVTRDGQPTTAVDWWLEGANLSVTIDDGVLSVGDEPDSYFVHAVSQENPGLSAVAHVVVEDYLAVQLIGPATSTISALDAVTFYASVTPQGADPSVTWSVASGAVLGVSWYQAYVADAPGTFYPTATSVSSPSARGSLEVVVEPAPGPEVFPTVAAPATRARHAAVLLADGDVQIIGGALSQDSSDRAEAVRYDASQQVFHDMAAPPEARPGSLAVALPDGRVLWTGGRLVWNLAADDGYLYDPVADSYTTTAPMSARRIDHAAVLLTAGAYAGQVLLIGGLNGPVPYGDPVLLATATVDRFDPATGAITPHFPLSQPRAACTVTALATGELLLTGGYDPVNNLPVASAELYDPDSGQASVIGNLNQPRAWHTATRVAGGRVLVMSDGSAELYDPATGAFTLLPEQPLRPRRAHTATPLPDGRVLFVGGTWDAFVWGSAETWHPVDGFQFYGGLQTPRSGHSATLLTTGPDAGAVLVVGGELNEGISAVGELLR